MPLSQKKPSKKSNRTSKSLSELNSNISGSGVGSFPIVALGGSAGSFHAFEKFLTHMPADSGMCFVIILHLDPNHLGKVSDLIQKFTQMPVLEAEDGLKVEANKVYVIPPNTDMGIHNGTLLLLSPSTPKGYRLPIDYFLQSLAEDQWNKAIGIIFSGMGSDGETGIRMIKEKLGLTMVQDPATAEYNSMPLAAINTNLIDFVLSPEEMPLKLIRYLSHPVLLDSTDNDVISETKNTNAIHKILMLIRSHNGHDFTLYKKNTISRRIDRRIAFLQLSDYGQYVNYLRENPHEIDILFQELLIGVTKFFRDPHAFEILTEKLYAILQNKKDGEPIRIWVAGCSTGEEAYSLAIILMEFLQSIDNKRIPKVQIFATDLDLEAIEHARAGVYYNNIVADVSPERLNNFFVHKNDCYQVKKELREMIVFAQHNLIKDAPFTRLDLLTCRNVMIYLTTELQKKIIPIFHYSINPKALLFLGPAETVGGFTDMFSPIESKWKIFERKDGTASMSKMIDFPFHVSKQPLVKHEALDISPKKKTLADTFSKILLENYTPASVLINEKGDIVYINGRTGKFLELNSGEAVMNIFRMAKEELKYVLSNAIHQAKNSTAEVCIEDIKLKEDNEMRILNLKVNLLDGSPLQGLILVVFEDKGLVKKTKRKAGGERKRIQAAAVEELEKELIYTKQQLHSTVEQMETSVEELKSTNEELQSTNEELQSTNEEALTTKEEMQSLNEELMTINVQYQAKAEELTILNNDMKNMLDNTEIGTVFLDNNLKILRFTPQIKKIFNVIDSDLGRSITHIASNFDNLNIELEIREVIEKLIVKELEVKTKNSEWFSLRIMPYRTTDNFINGAVLTINKITLLKELRQDLEVLQKYVAKTINSFQHSTLLLNEDLKIVTANDTFFKTFFLKEKEIYNRSFPEVMHKNWNVSNLERILTTGNFSETVITIEQEYPEPVLKRFKLTATPFPNDETKKASALLLSIEEISNEGE